MSRTGYQLLKFLLSKKATKNDKVFTVNFTLSSKCQIDGEDTAFLENTNFIHDPLELVRVILMVQSGSEGPQFARSVCLLMCISKNIFELSKKCRTLETGPYLAKAENGNLEM